MKLGDFFALAIVLYAAGFATCLLFTERVAAAQRVEYLAKCTSADQVWVNVRLGQVKCGALGNFWFPPSEAQLSKEVQP